MALRGGSLIQGGGIDKRPSSGHFGAWTICTELFASLRVKGHDATGVLLMWQMNHHLGLFVSVPRHVSLQHGFERNAYFAHHEDI
jgi:hypothetical protein